MEARALLAAAALAVSALVPSVAAAAPARSLTVTFAGTGGSELTTLQGSFKPNPLCTATFDARQNLTDLAWRVKWRRVRLPKPGKTVKALATTTFAGNGKLDMTMRYEPGCGQPSPPPESCAGALSPQGEKAELALRWSGRGSERKLIVTVAAVPDAEQSGGETDALQSQAEDCEFSPRAGAFAAEVAVPANPRRIAVLPVDPTANEHRAPDLRGHHEQSGEEEGVRMSVVSDVAWSGVVAVRGNRRR
jgi:hypothetical protein